MAEVVAVAVANADAHWQLGEQARNMRLAMESRAVIEQAKGVLMAQRQVDAEQAFEILREASQRYNRKLRDIALGHRGVHPAAAADRSAGAVQARPAATRGTPPRPRCRRVSATSTAVGRRRHGPPVDQRLPAAGAEAGVDDDVAAHGAERARAAIASVTASASCTTTPVVP